MENLHSSKRPTNSLPSHYHNSSEPAYPLYEELINQRKLIQSRRKKEKRTFRNRWRRNLQSIAYNFPDYDFLSDAYVCFFNYLRSNNPILLAKAYNFLGLYSEANHLQRNIPDYMSSKKSRRSRTTLRCLFDKFSLNKDSNNLSDLLSGILLYTKKYDPVTLRENEDFSRDLNLYLRSYFTRIKNATKKTRLKILHKQHRKIG